MIKNKKSEKIDCVISYNPDEEMMSISDKNDKCLFYGNYWDFDKSPTGIAEFLKKIGLKVKIDKKLKSVNDE